MPSARKNWLDLASYSRQGAKPQHDRFRRGNPHAGRGCCPPQGRQADGLSFCPERRYPGLQARRHLALPSFRAGTLDRRQQQPAQDDGQGTPLMEILDNINQLFGDDLKQALKPGAKLKIAASCFSMYAYEALKAELEQIEELRFIFTSPTFVADEVTDQVKRERREFHIP